MTPDRWRQVTAIFHAARGHEAAVRGDYLDRACGSDASLRSEVNALLAADGDPRSLGDAATGLEILPQLSPGTAFGPYEIDGLIGAGGMGQVYRASDRTLGRAVAIKVLLPSLVQDAGNDARLEREARVLASINHPNIATVHGLETAAGIQGIVLEFVEGPTLAERLAVQPVSVPEALTIARQIASALEAAHANGVVHRDLKPANIKITPAGVVKVLDFGIARLTADAAARHGQGTPATDAGLILGTPAYMSPEQARGEGIDKRTDIWAFGCVLYEMLTGRGAFAARTASDSLARLLEADPDWTALPAATPTSIVRLLQRCLKKDRAERLRDIGDAGLEIGDALAPPGAPSASPATSRRGAFRAVGAAAIIALVAIGYWIISGRSNTAAPAPSSIELGIMFPSGNLPAHGMAVSPDGRYIVTGVFGNRQQLWLHTLETGATRLMPGTEDGFAPFWSPDSEWIGFLRRGEIFKVRPASGPPLSIARLGGTGAFCSWGTQNEILCSSHGRFMRFPSTGGAPIDRPTVDVEAAMLPMFLPDARHFLFFSRQGSTGRVYLGALDSPRATPLGDADSPASFAPPDRVLFVRGTSLLAQRLDLEGQKLVGEAELVASGVNAGTAYERHLMWVSASATGLLAFQTPRGGSAGQLTWFDRDGRPTGSMPSPPDTEYLNPAISPDGTMLAANRVDPQSGNWDVWIIDIASGVASRLTTDAAFDGDPVWSPDGREIAFMSERDGALALYRQPISGGGAPERMLDLRDATFAIPSQWSTNGDIIFHRASAPRWEIWAVPVKGDRKPVPLIKSEYGVYAGRISPDGQWLAYNSFETGPLEVFVKRLDADGPKKQISSGGGVHPRWASNNELIYWAPPGGIFSNTLSLTSAEIRVGPRISVIDHPVLSLIDARTHYDLTPDGKRLLVRQPAGPAGPGIKVILNWTSRLRR